MPMKHRYSKVCTLVYILYTESEFTFFRYKHFKQYNIQHFIFTLFGKIQDLEIQVVYEIQKIS